MESKLAHPQHYVTVSHPPPKRSREPTVTFELWDSDNCLTPVTTSASANLPVCVVHIPGNLVPSANFDPDSRPALFIISSNGSVTLDLDPTDSNSLDDYFKIMALTMAACLRVWDKYASPMSTTFPKTLRGSDHPPAPVYLTNMHGRTMINLGKMFVGICVGTAGPRLDAPGYTAIVDWPIPLGHDARVHKTKPVAVMTYKVVAWSLMCDKLPKIRYMVPREPMAGNLTRFIILECGPHT